MENETCSLCLDIVDGENADILTMSAYGTPKYLCPECAKRIENVMSGTDYDSIVISLDELNSTVIKNNIDNRAVMEAITAILANGAERARKIKDGTLDFDNELAEAENEEEFDITEELAESEEDRLLDEKEAEEKKKFDKITSIISGVIFALAVGYMIWYFFIS